MLWSAKAYDREELEELCRKVPNLCETMWCNPNCIWVWLGLAALVFICLWLLILWLRK